MTKKPTKKKTKRISNLTEELNKCVIPQAPTKETAPLWTSPGEVFHETYYRFEYFHEGIWKEASTRFTDLGTAPLTFKNCFAHSTFRKWRIVRSECQITETTIDYPPLTNDAIP